MLGRIRSRHRRCSIEEGALKDFTKFTGNTCARVSFLIKLLAKACNFIKKETLAQVFSCEFCEIFKNTFFTDYLQATPSVGSEIRPCDLLNMSITVKILLIYKTYRNFEIRRYLDMNIATKYFINLILS